MLTMHTQDQKQKIVAETFRLLRPGGRYSIHELCIVPSEVDSRQEQQIDRDLSSAIHAGARPLRMREWKELLERAGFRVLKIGYAPMHLLRLKRLIEDEGVIGALRVAKNVLLHPKARRRVCAMREVFERYRRNLNAIYIIARKQEPPLESRTHRA
jgi:hypothetical protein